MTVAVIVLGVCLIVCFVVSAYLLHDAKDERKDLEDRVMALSQPISLITHRAPRDPSTVDYIDEQREYELNPPVDLSEVP